MKLTPLPKRLAIRPESEIMQGWKDPDAPLMVSVCCATYNHAAFIEDAICGVLGQQTDFRYELIIRDDASTDGTSDIVRAYAAKYPHIIRAVIHDENQFQKGIRPAHAWSHLATGKCIAYCEGDDYWIDPHKLQQQVDILEANPDIVLCTGGYYSTNVHASESRLVIDKPGAVLQDDNGYAFTLDDTLDVWLTKLLTAVHRKEARKDMPSFDHSYNGDVILFYHLLRQGKGYYLTKPLGVYRIHQGGVHSMIGAKAKLLSSYRTYRELYMLSGDSYTRTLSLRHALLLIGYRSSADQYGDIHVPRVRLLHQSLGLARTFGELVRIFRAAMPHSIKDLKQRIFR